MSIASGSLRLDGEPWWPTGVNAYQLGTDWSINAGCGAMVDLDAYFGSRPPGSVTRFNVFQQLAVNKHSGEIDFRALDRVFAAAERANQLVIPVLGAQDGACGNEKYKDHDWYTTGWKEAADFPLSYAEWLSTAVKRWADSRSVAAWELIGEPEAGECSASGCELADRRCPADATTVLRTWVDRASAIVRHADPRHLVTIGLIGGDQCGSAGEGFARISASPGLDFVQFHDYEPTPFLDKRLAGKHKPILIAETGVRAGSCLSLTDRADQLAERMDRYRELGAAGALLWAFVPDPRLGECTYDIGPADPVLDIPQMTTTS